ncbi:MAG: MFS transporter [Clostridia bacterium]|nr:MFS transporter [Clostridia bacterium]
MSSEVKRVCNRLTDKKHVGMLAMTCAFVYTVSYMTRINYKVVISEIIASEGITKTDASLALTGLFICYAIGQLISGWLGDRISPKYLMTCGLTVSTLMNVLVTLSGDKVWVVTVWCINGFGQALMWPPIVRILTDYLSNRDYISSCVKVSWGGHIGTIVIYLISPLLIAVMNWRSVFIFSACFGTIGALVTFISLSHIEKYAKEHGEAPEIPAQNEPDNAENRNNAAATIGKSGIILLIPILVGTFLQGTIKDGVDTWMPSYINDNFDLSTKISILSGVILPVFAIVCVKIANVIYNKYLKNELLCSGVMFSAMALGALGLFAITAFGFEGIASLILSLLCFTLLSGATHGVNLMQTAMIPRQYGKTGRVSLIAGIINFIVYVGSSVSTYGFAKMTDTLGWKGTVLLWVAISLAGAVVSFAVLTPWKKFVDSDGR